MIYQLAITNNIIYKSIPMHDRLPAGCDTTMQPLPDVIRFPGSESRQIRQNPGFAGIPGRAGFATNDTIIISCGKDDAVESYVRFS